MVSQLEKMEEMLNEKTSMILKLERAENKLRARINKYGWLEQQMRESDVKEFVLECLQARDKIMSTKQPLIVFRSISRNARISSTKRRERTVRLQDQNRLPL